MLRATGGAECSNRGERVFKYTRPPLRSRDGVFAVELLLLAYASVAVMSELLSPGARRVYAFPRGGEMFVLSCAWLFV